MELTLPMNYMEIEQEEMEYLDGGSYISRGTARSAIASLAMTPSTFIAAATSVHIVTRAMRWIANRFGGIWSRVAGLLVSWAGAQVLALGVAVGRGALNKGVTISWNWNIFKDPVGVNATVHY